MSKSYRDFSTFHDTKNVKLQTWNRCNVLFNLNEDLGPNQAGLYMEQFGNRDKTKCLAMLAYINQKGYDYVNREMNRVE